MARALGATAVRVTTAAELQDALGRAEADPGAYLIEAVTARDDLSPVMARIRAHVRQASRPRTRHPELRPGASRAGDASASVRPRILRDVLDRDEGGDLLAADGRRGELPESDGVKVAEDMLRSGGQEEPGSFGQLVLELAGPPARMTDIEDHAAFLRGGQRLHGVQLGGDIDVVGDDHVRQRPAIVESHQGSADRSSMPHEFLPSGRPTG